MKSLLRYRYATLPALFVLPYSAWAVDPISTLLTGLDLSGVSTSIATLSVTVIAIAFGIKGISVVKRVIGKI